jgi:hypothetical protein
MVPTQEKQIFPLNLYWTELKIFYFCCVNGSPDGRDVQAELTAGVLDKNRAIDNVHKHNTYLY